MGFTEEIRSQLFSAWAHWGADGPSMNCDLLRTSTRAVSSRVGGCGGSPTLEARTVEGADLHHERCLSQIIIPFAPQIINRPLKLKVVKDNNFNYGQWKELPEECQNNKAESGTCSC